MIFLVINNSIESIISYLKINNYINETKNISKYQKAMCLNLHMLKLSIDDSKLVKIILNSVKELEKSRYQEIRCEALDISLRRIVSNIEKVEEILKEFQLQGNKFSKLKNIFFNDTFGSLNQFKIELENRFNCEEIKIPTPDNAIIDW